MVSRYMSNPRKVHYKLGLLYGDGLAESGVVKGFVDLDFGGNVDKRKSLIGYVFTAWGSAISWKANLQSIVTFFSTEIKYIATTKVVKESLWLKGTINELGINQKVVVIQCDSQSALHLMKNHVYHKRTKHIDVQMHFIRDILA
ncbi:hypothetical protein AAG906_025765 [Vitis piasezkii]